MQCSRCHGHFRQVKSTRSKVNWAKLKYRTHLGLVEPAQPDGSNGQSWSAAVDHEIGASPPSFIQAYKSVLLISAVTFLFCASVLIYLSYSALNLGIVAVPFLTIFTAGLLISVGLPIKLRREYAVIMRG